MADTPKMMTTYRRKDGSDIDGHAWVTDDSWFDDLDEPVEIITETWVLGRGRDVVGRSRSVLP